MFAGGVKVLFSKNDIPLRINTRMRNGVDRSTVVGTLGRSCPPPKSGRDLFFSACTGGNEKKNAKTFDTRNQLFKVFI